MDVAIFCCFKKEISSLLLRRLGRRRVKIQVNTPFPCNTDYKLSSSHLRKDGYMIPEIAGYMGIRHNTVRNHLQVAIKKMEACLQ
jgi:hypothetical protein